MWGESPERMQREGPFHGIMVDSEDLKDFIDFFSYNRSLVNWKVQKLSTKRSLGKRKERLGIEWICSEKSQRCPLPSPFVHVSTFICPYLDIHVSMHLFMSLWPCLCVQVSFAHASIHTCPYVRASMHPDVQRFMIHVAMRPNIHMSMHPCPCPRSCVQTSKRSWCMCSCIDGHVHGFICPSRCVHMSICPWVHISRSMCLDVHVHGFICPCPCVRMSTSMCPYVHVNVSICPCPWVHMSMCMHPYVHAHASICPCPYTHMPISMPIRPCPYAHRPMSNAYMSMATMSIWPWPMPMCFHVQLEREREREREREMGTNRYNYKNFLHFSRFPHKFLNFDQRERERERERGSLQRPSCLHQHKKASFPSLLRKQPLRLSFFFLFLICYLFICFSPLPLLCI